MAILIKNKQELKLMRKSGRLAHQLLYSLGAAVEPGATGQQLDQLARRILASAGARSPFLGQRAGAAAPPYPATITVSPNEAVVHGIPNDHPFAEGDIISLDVGVQLDGFMGDNAATFPAGPISERAQRLLDVTRESLMRGIRAATVGNTVGDIGHAVQTHAEGQGYAVVRCLVGHGVGRTLWEEPQVPNFGRPGEGVKLRPGMTIAIEPMINEGTADVRQLPDRWTYVTADGLLSAHFEHSIAILSDGPEILTIE